MIASDITMKADEKERGCWPGARNIATARDRGPIAHDVIEKHKLAPRTKPVKDQDNGNNGQKMRTTIEIIPIRRLDMECRDSN